MSPPATALHQAGSHATKRFPIFFWFGFASFHKLCDHTLCTDCVLFLFFLTYFIHTDCAFVNSHVIIVLNV